MRQTVIYHLFYWKYVNGWIASILEVCLLCYLLVFRVEAKEMKPVSEQWQEKEKGRDGK